MHTKLNPSSVGGSLSFVIAADESPLSDAGAYIGVSAGTAVEFDTLVDVKFRDVNENHVGLDLGSMPSRQTPPSPMRPVSSSPEEGPAAEWRARPIGHGPWSRVREGIDFQGRCPCRFRRDF